MRFEGKCLHGWAPAWMVMNDPRINGRVCVVCYEWDEDYEYWLQWMQVGRTALSDGFALNMHRDETHTFIQWKGTDACFDFRCECGEVCHWDGFFAYAVKCPGCLTLWEMPSILFPRKAPPGYDGCIVEPERETE